MIPIYIDEANKYREIFPINPLAIIPTAGLQYGHIIKFKTFYVKIYYMGDNDSYDFYAYLYGNDKHEIHDVVSRYNLMPYCARFNTDNYLIGINK